MNFIKVNDLIKSLPKRSKTPEALIAIQVRQIAREALFAKCADLPREILEKVRVLSFRNGTLTLKAPSLLSAELYTRSDGLVDYVNRAIGKEVVKRIKFKVV